MKKFSALIFSLFLTCAVVFSASSAFAYAEADSDAWLGAATITGGTLIGMPAYTAWAEVWGNPGGHAQDSGITAFAGSAWATAAGYDVNGNPIEETWAKADGNGDWAGAMAWSEVVYTYEATATSLKVDQMWGYLQTLKATADGDYADAFSRVYIGVNYDTGWLDHTTQAYNYLEGIADDFTAGTDGEILHTYEFTGLTIGETYEVRAGVYNEAYASTAGGQVPVPAAIWLLGSGLLGLVGLRKKNKS